MHPYNQSRKELDPLVKGTDPGIRIRIRSEMSRIPNTDFAPQLRKGRKIRQLREEKSIGFMRVVNEFARRYCHLQYVFEMYL